MGNRFRSGWFFAAALLALFLASSAAAQTPAPERELVAVLEFDATGASREQAVAITDRMRQRLLESGRFRLVEREMMDKILTEQAFQQTGCTSQECAVQVGKILGVRKMINGKLARVDANAWVVSATMTDVETAETLRAASIEQEGNFLSVLGTGTANLMVRLIGQSEGGLSELMAAAGLTKAPEAPKEPKAPKHPRTGYGIAVAYSPGLEGSGAEDGAAAQMGTTSAMTGFHLDHQWGIGAASSLLLMAELISAPAKEIRRDPDIVEKIDLLLSALGMEYRYWYLGAGYVGAQLGVMQQEYQRNHIAPKDSLTQSSGKDTITGGTWYGLTAGWESDQGWNAALEYQVLNPGIDTYAGFLLKAGYRFK